MSSWFNLILDTTPPVVEIISPQYTAYNVHTEITVQSNENLMNYQEIYVIDSIGERHDLTFLYDGDNFYFDAVFNDTYSLGIATIFVRLKDDVGNITNLISKPIEIIQNTNDLIVMLSDYCRNLNINDNKMKIELSISDSGINLSLIEANIIIDDILIEEEV